MTTGKSLKKLIWHYERDVILKMLEAKRGSIRATAAALGITRDSLYLKIYRLALSDDLDVIRER